jgi:hypothetical protein
MHQVYYWVNIDSPTSVLSNDQAPTRRPTFNPINFIEIDRDFLNLAVSLTLSYQAPYF